MKKKIIRIFLYSFAFLCLLAFSIFDRVDRTPYQQTAFYKTMSQRLDTLQTNFPTLDSNVRLKTGFASINITPPKDKPLAGYSYRVPKTMEGIKDSIYIHAFVFDNGNKKVALLTLDLLIVHPYLKNVFMTQLKRTNWNFDDIYLTASHSHSSVGGWIPDFIGKFITGDFDQSFTEHLALKMVEALVLAEKNKTGGALFYSQLKAPELISNRLVGQKGIVDSTFHIFKVQNLDKQAQIAIFAAHPTCFGESNRSISNDYPAFYNKHILQNDSSISISSFVAGAMGSMGIGNKVNFNNEGINADSMGTALANVALANEQFTRFDTLHIRAFKIQIPLRQSQFKISTNWIIRPWLFHLIVGDYPAEISVLQMNQLLFVGLPCDFSGELAVPLYPYAKKNNLNLVITSFNGDYIGYIPHDKWYDLEEYETLSMSWYGFDNGAYFSEVIEKIISFSAK